MRRQLVGGDLARPDRLDQPVELLQATLEGAKQGVSRARQPALEDGHGEPGRRAVQDAGAVVVVVDVVGRLVVEGLLADLALRQVVAEGVADAARVDALAVEADHLLLGAADEVTAPGVGRIGVEGVHRRQDFGLQQPPESIVREVLAHVRRGGQEQKMVAAQSSDQRGSPSLDARERLGDPVAIGLADREVRLAIGAELVASSKIQRS